MKCLVADDSRKMRELVIGLLHGYATEIIECGDGDSALASYAQHRPDWVFMDIRMAPLDGLTATSLIKSRFPEARILIVTSHNEEQLEAAALNAGACGFFLKENLFELLEFIDSSFGRNTTAPTAPAKEGSAQS